MQVQGLQYNATSTLKRATNVARTSEANDALVFVALCRELATCQVVSMCLPWHGRTLRGPETTNGGHGSEGHRDGG